MSARSPEHDATASPSREIWKQSDPAGGAGALAIQIQSPLPADPCKFPGKPREFSLDTIVA